MVPLVAGVVLFWIGSMLLREFLRAHGGRLWLAGALMAVPLTIPLVNLLVPVLGAATFTHLVNRLARL